MEIGDMIRLDDWVTGFDDNKEGRPYMVVHVEDPPLYVWVLPRTTDTRASGAGILVPRGVIRTLNQDGRFMYRAYRLAIEEVEQLTVFDQVQQPLLATILQQVNRAEVELD
jgi:hypothetical protein